MLKYLTTGLDHIKTVEHGFFTRLGNEPEGVALLKQIHSNKVIVAPFQGKPEGDAIVTAERGLVIGVVTADCAPVLFAAKKEKIVGAAHAGWRGAIGGVLENTIAAMKKLGATDIEAAIGPCIGFASYEVSGDFDKPFIEQSSDNAVFFKPAARDGHLMFDLPGYVASRLKNAGITKIYDTRQDTLANEGLFYSYRRSTLRGENTGGRQLSVIAVK